MAACDAYDQGPAVSWTSEASSADRHTRKDLPAKTFRHASARTMDERSVDARSLPEHDIDGWVATNGPGSTFIDLSVSFCGTRMDSSLSRAPAHLTAVNIRRPHDRAAENMAFPAADSVGRCPVIFPLLTIARIEE